MNKYIDADKLIAEIEKRQEYLGDHNFHSMASEYDWLLTMVQSLQQEQPEGLHFTPLNRLIQKIPSEKWNDRTNNYAKKLRDCLIKEGYLKDANVLQGYISYMNGNNVPIATMDEQEQPEVDLEKEIAENLGDVWNDTPVEVKQDMIKFAHHFWNKGYNARKEESK